MMPSCARPRRPCRRPATSMRRRRPSWRAASSCGGRRRRPKPSAPPPPRRRPRRPRRPRPPERAAAAQQAEVERLQATLDQAESHRRGLQRLVEAIRQRDAGLAALRAAASEVELELEPGALERVSVAGERLALPQRTWRIVDPLRDRDRRHRPDPGPAGGCGPQAPAEQHQGRRAPDRARARRRSGCARRRPGCASSSSRLATELPLAGRPDGLAARAGEAPTWPEAAAVETASAERTRQIDALAAQLRPARRECEELVDARHRTAAAHGQAAARLAQAERHLEQLQAELAGAELATEEAVLAERAAALQRALAARRAPAGAAAGAHAGAIAGRRSSSGSPS